MIAVIDYGVGNVFSLCRSFEYIGAEAVLTKDPDVIGAADRLVLPGVGAFADAALKLRESGMADLILKETAKGKPLLGICLGMQLLFEESSEYGNHKGLGLIPGKVISMEGIVPASYKIPHIGWNRLRFPKDREKSPIFRELEDGDFVYFVHSYFGTDCAQHVTAVTEYGAELTAAVSSGTVYGVQFHPEKSGETGMKILRAFCGITS